MPLRPPGNWRRVMDRRIAEFALWLTALLLVNASRASAQQVFVVGPPGPGVFSQQIQPAIDAAFDGDVVLVKSSSGGSTGYWTISDKSITLIAEAGVKPQIAPGTIRNIPASKHVTVRGFEILYFLHVQSDGPVWIEDCDVNPWFVLGGSFATIVTVNNSASVTFQRCTVSSTVTFEMPPPTTLLKNSNVYAYSSKFRGAMG